MVHDEAAGDGLVHVVGEDVLPAKFDWILVRAVADDLVGHGRRDAGEVFEFGAVGGVDVNAGFDGLAGEAVADAEDGGFGAAGDGGGGAGGVVADTLLITRAVGAAEENDAGTEEEERACVDLHA